MKEVCKLVVGGGYFLDRLVFFMVSPLTLYSERDNLSGKVNIRASKSSDLTMLLSFWSIGLGSDDYDHHSPQIKGIRCLFVRTRH